MTTDNASSEYSRGRTNYLRQRAQHLILVGEYVIEMRSVLSALNSVLIDEYTLYNETDKSAPACWHDCVLAIDALTDVLMKLNQVINDACPDCESDIMALRLSNSYACKEHRIATIALPDLPEEYQEPEADSPSVD